MRQKAGRVDSRSGLKLLLRRNRSVCAILSVLTVLGSLTLVGIALASRSVLDTALGNREHLTVWCAALLVLAVATPALRATSNSYAGQVTDRIVAELRSDMLTLLLKKECKSVNAYHSGHLYSRLMNDCRTVCELYTTVWPTVFGQIFQLIFALAAVMLISPLLAVAALLAGCCAAGCSVLIRKFLKGYHTEARQAEEQLSACLQEHLERLEVLRSIGAPGEVNRRFQRRQQRWLRVRTTLRRISVSCNAGFSILVQLAYVVVIVWGAVAIRNDALTFGALTAILQLVGMFRSPISGLSGVQGRLAAVDASFERLAELCELPDETGGASLEPDEQCIAIQFRNVTFSYEGEEQPVLRSFNARLEFGKWNCMVGASGRGKSTVYRLLLGLYSPQEGEILLETDRRVIPCSGQTRSLFSYVPQSSVLFSGTLRENLLLAKPDASEWELWDVLRLAECEFVKELPQGLDTVLGESGLGLSVGQGQRVAIARALLSDGKILLLDEITASLDGDTERRVIRHLFEAYPSALIATHRPDVLTEYQPNLVDLGEEL